MSPDEQRWNLSPERLYIDCWTRAFLRERLDPADCGQTCNVGIGVGEWDDWLGYWLLGHGTLASVDIDERIVEGLSIRQRRQGHPNPARVIHGDLLQATLGPFDLVTVVGSTLQETHAPAQALRAAVSWVRPGGWLYATALHSLSDPTWLFDALGGVQHRARFDALPDAEFTAVLARRAQA